MPKSHRMLLLAIALAVIAVPIAGMRPALAQAGFSRVVRSHSVSHYESLPASPDPLRVRTDTPSRVRVPDIERKAALGRAYTHNLIKRFWHPASAPARTALREPSVRRVRNLTQRAIRRTSVILELPLTRGPTLNLTHSS